MQIEAGTKLGRYEIRSKIGEGGMGEVYRAPDEKLNRDVAIKVLPASLSQDEGRLHRFEQEAQAAGTLNHANILAVYDVGVHVRVTLRTRQPCFVSEGEISHNPPAINFSLIQRFFQKSCHPEIPTSSSKWMAN